MAIEDKTAKSAPAFNSSNLNQSRAASRGTYFVQTKPTRVSPLKKAAPKTNPAKILSMKLQKQKSVFEDPAPESNIHLDLSGLKTALSRLAMILLALLVAGGIGYAIYYFATREKVENSTFTFESSLNRRLTAAVARVQGGDYNGAETILNQIDVKNEATCTKARYYAAYNYLYAESGRGGSVPARDVAKYLSEIMDECIKEAK